MRDMSAFAVYVLFALIACASPAMALSDDAGDCGSLESPGQYGPFDYRTATPFQKKLVEGVHFTHEVEALRGGVTGTIGGEIGYTLRAFPNHPRALMAMVRLGQRDKTRKAVGAIYSVECFLERATVFRPDDVNVWLVRGIYFTLQRQYDSAIADFNSAIQVDPQNANAHYNLGLAYFETKQYEKATEEAKLAKSLGFPLDGLRTKLTAARQWRD
jgi:tetratricopeptide (TPR) repeat protein